MPEVLVRSLKNRNTSEVLHEMLEASTKMQWMDHLQDKKKVVIKPNLCYLAPWESGVTTNVDVVEDLIRYLRTIKTDIQITIIESDNNDRRSDDAFEKLRYLPLKDKYDIEILNLTREPCQEVVVPNLHYSIRIPEIFFDDVFFISVANLKVHLYQKMTGICKNQFGCVPDEIKERYHQYMEETLYALNKLIKPDISIIDGKIGLEGIGPVTGMPVKSEIMLMSNDPTAIDTIAAQVMGLDPMKVPHLVYAYEREKTRPRDYKAMGMGNLPSLNFKTHESFNLIRAKINVTRFTDSWNIRLKRFTAGVYNTPSFLKRVYGFGMRKIRRVTGR